MQRKQADKLNDFLRSPQARPDLQTPEAQQFLNFLENGYHNEQTDPMMPWLVREWKKGRLRPAGQAMEDPANYAPNMQYQTAPAVWENGEEVTPARWGGIMSPDFINHAADFYHSNHPLRQGFDLMKLQAHELRPKISEWDEAMKKHMGDRAESMGEVDYQWPDGWTVQRLRDPEHLKEEGETMGHCVGGYANSVQSGNTIIYSLRDANNEPHITSEITPVWGPEGRHCTVEGCDITPHRGDDGDYLCSEHGDTVDTHPDRGQMVQIQGKANEAPKEEYQKRFKEWVEQKWPNEEDRPEWEHQDRNEIDQLEDDGGYVEYHPGDYGLNEPNMYYDWKGIIDSVCDSVYGVQGYNYTRQADTILEHAEKEGEVSDLKYALEDCESSFESEFRDEWWNDPMSKAEEWGYSFDEPEPQLEDFPLEKDDEEDEDEDEDYDSYDEYDEHDYEEAHDRWERDRDDWLENVYEEIKDEAWRNDERSEFYSYLEGGIYNSQRRNRYGSRKVKYHPNFHTGKPCRCTFTLHLQPPKLASGKCPTCGDPMEDGGWCKRCDWGGLGFADSNDQNPIDPARDLKGPYQSKVSADDTHPCPSCGGDLRLDRGGDWRCDECGSAWADAGGYPDIDDDDDMGFGDKAEEDWNEIFGPWERQRQQERPTNLPNPNNVLPSAPATAPQFISPAEREQVIYNTLQEAWSDLQADPWEQSITTIGEVLPEELVQKGVAPDIAQEVTQEWVQQARTWFAQGKSDLTVPKEWTARIASHYSTRPSNSDWFI